MQRSLRQKYFDTARTGYDRPTVTARRARHSRERTIRVHDKIFCGLVILALLIAYDAALRIDEHVSFVTPQHAASLAFDDRAAAMHRF
jgi:hypothetical protein